MKGAQLVDAAHRTRIGEPALLLFLSVDLENSAQLKQILSRKNDRGWLAIAVGFVQDFPTKFSAKVDAIARDQKRQELVSPEVWKLLGDEIVFKVEIKAAHHVVCYVEAFRATINEWNQQAAVASEDDKFLLAKGACWVAGFPVTNMRVPTNRGPDDFLGPSIDAGFRVARCATPKRIAVSVDLAWLFLKASRQLNIRTGGRLYFDGRTALKGVAEQTGYPHLWLEAATSEFHSQEHAMLGRPGDQKYSEQLEALTSAFIREYGVPNFHPFIPGDPEFTPPPKTYQDDLRVVRQGINGMYPIEGEDRITATTDKQRQEAQALLDSLNAQVHGRGPAKFIFTSAKSASEDAPL